MESFSQDIELSTDNAVPVFKSIFGVHNLCVLDENNVNVWRPYLEHSIAGQLKVLGQMSLTVSLSPWHKDDQSAFFIEGFGRYITRDVPSGEDLVASADFRVYGGKLYRARQLGSEIDVFLEQHVVREFSSNRPRFAHPSAIVISVRLERLDDAIFTIDYRGGHPIGIEVQPTGHSHVPLSEKRLIAVEPVGCIWFDLPHDGRKLIDLRALDWVKDNYEPDLRDAGFQPESGALDAQWTHKPACKVRDESPPTKVALPWSVEEIRKQIGCDDPTVVEDLRHVQPPVPAPPAAVPPTPVGKTAPAQKAKGGNGSPAAGPVLGAPSSRATTSTQPSR